MCGNARWLVPNEWLHVLKKWLRVPKVWLPVRNR